MITVNRWALIANIAYLIGDFTYSWFYFSRTILSTYLNFALLCTYYFSNILNSASALHYVNCTQLCRERLKILRKILRNFRNYPTERLDVVLHLYIRISNQIFLINRFMGFVVLLKLTHDLTLGTSIAYKMC